jgi:hypothetical protein
VQAPRYLKPKSHLSNGDPPDHNEPRRVISTKANGELVYLWDATTNRWKPENPPVVSVAAATVTPEDATSDAALRAQVADVQRQLRALNKKL